MKVVSPLDLQGSIHIADTYIIFGYTDKAKAEGFLNGLKNLEAFTPPYFDEQRKTMTISFVERTHTFQYSIVPSEMAGQLTNYEPKRILIPDFADSEMLYKGIASQGPTLKIIEDKYSARRGVILFEYISEIEKGLRLKYNDFYSTAELKKSKQHRSKGRDHFITYYTLTEMVDEQLLAPASDEHYISLLRTASTDEDRLAARAATRLEELEIPLSPDDLRLFIAIRNEVMHFRVVTYPETVTLLNLAQSYQHFVTRQVIGELQLRRGK